MTAPLPRAEALLADQHERLSAVIAGNAPPEVKSLARRYLAKVRTWQSHPEASRDLALGAMGENGLAPAIRDVEARAAFHVGQSQEPKARAA